MTLQEVKPLRRRIGIVCPDDGINDDEYWQYVPADVTLLWTRYRTPRTFDPISVEMVGSYGDMGIVEQAAKTLEITRPEVVVFCCNSCGFVHGLDGDKRIREAISRATGSPAISVTDSEVEALRALGVKRVAVGGPYPEDVTSKLVELLEGEEFEVTATKSLQLDAEWLIGNCEPAVWAQLARDINSDAAECILLACSGIRTAPIIDSLEKELGKPVISAPASTMWHALRTIGVKDQVSGFGKLFELH